MLTQKRLLALTTYITYVTRTNGSLLSKSRTEPFKFQNSNPRGDLCLCSWFLIGCNRGVVYSHRSFSAPPPPPPNWTSPSVLNTKLLSHCIVRDSATSLIGNKPRASVGHIASIKNEHGELLNGNLRSHRADSRGVDEKTRSRLVLITIAGRVLSLNYLRLIKRAVYCHLVRQRLGTVSFCTSVFALLGI
ncbi:hypothetical protein H4582DRAFT_1378416 [Lactarius indigo]|nr:hypothetical protein H4582DRAFT_1378416 [Lactarius indigo]